jgi:regulator of sirC expression with transglutaminase-like and TPR domain
VTPETLLRLLGTTPGKILPIAEAALAYAALARPGLDLTFYRAHLAVLAKAVAAIGAETPETRAEALAQVLGRQFNYRGDNETYDDLDNADLARVIDRQRGLPVALGILYIAVARAQGWSAFGLNFPGHFLIALGEGGERLILDPFDRGTICDPARLEALLRSAEGLPGELKPEHCRPVGDRDVVLRLENNIKLRLIQAGRTAEALTLIERMLLLVPEHAQLWTELAQLNAKEGRMNAAIVAAETAIGHAATPGQREQAAGLLRGFRARLN